MVYKELNLKDKLDKLSFDEKIFLLASNGKLVKRPILILKDKNSRYKERIWELKNG